MEITVFVERLHYDRYRATSGEPFGCRVEAPTRDEALRKLRLEIESKFVAGTEVVRLDIPGPHPMLKMAGCFDPNDPMVQEWIDIMAENRRKADEDPDYL